MYKSNATKTKPSRIKKSFHLTTKQFDLVNNSGDRPSSFINGFNTYMEIIDFIDNCNKTLLDKRELKTFNYANGTYVQKTFSSTSCKY